MMRPAEGASSETWRRFRRSRLAAGALIYIGLVTLIAVAAPLLANRRALAERTAAGWRFPAFVRLSADIDAPPTVLSRRVMCTAWGPMTSAAMFWRG